MKDFFFSVSKVIVIVIILSLWLVPVGIIMMTVIISNCEKQPPKVFCEKGVLKNFRDFKGKHLC